MTQAEEERDNVYPWYEINNMIPSVCKKMDGKGGDLDKCPRTTRAAAIAENDEKTRARSRVSRGFESDLMCFDVMISLDLRQLRQVLVGFSFHLNGNLQISQSFCAWKLGESWYIGVPPWIKVGLVALQRGYKVRD